MGRMDNMFQGAPPSAVPVVEQNRGLYNYGGTPMGAAMARTQYRSQADDYERAQREAFGRQQQARGDEQAQIDRLGRIASGQLAAPAEGQLRRTEAAGEALTQSQAASARGGVAAAMAARQNAAALNASSRQNLVGQSDIVRAQAQQQAQDQLAAALAQQRQQDMAMRGQALGYESGALGAGLGLTDAQNQLNMGYAGNQQGLMQGAAGAANAYAQQAAKQRLVDDQNFRSDVGLGLSTVGTVGAFLSDENAKTDVRDGSGPAELLMQQFAPYKYRYKGDDKPRLGVLAQRLAKTPEGRSLVKDTPKGKAIDVGQGLGAALASIGDLHRRVKQLEKEASRG